MKYYLIAGEASGDLHASNLMYELKRIDKDAEFRFYGGDKMESIGGTLVKHYREMAYMGFIPIIMHLRTIMRNMSECKKDIACWKPDAVILVDYPGFNLDIAKYVHSNGISKVYYYISPKIWAWKEYRIKAIRRDVDKLFSILPFEVEWFAERHYPICYVGNPCVDAINAEGFLGKRTNNDSGTHKRIAILSGSRKQEINSNLAMMLAAASQFDGYELTIAAAPNIDRDLYETNICKAEKIARKKIDVNIVSGKTYEILSTSDAALVTSGTATLETAIIGTPQVVCYHMGFGKIVSLLRKLVLKVRYISLVNLIANEDVVEELVADGMTVSNIARNLKDILPGGKRREKMLKGYELVNKRLGSPGASRKAAEEIVKLSF